MLLHKHGTGRISLNSYHVIFDVIQSKFSNILKYDKIAIKCKILRNYAAWAVKDVTEDEVCRKVPEELVLPFLWAQDGFDQPSANMAQAIRTGLDIPAKFSMLAG
jgi:hypothetical protein